MIADEQLKKAPNIEAILDWVDERRPDIRQQVRQVISDGWRRDPKGEAILFLMTICFTAGRHYQAKHPEISPEIYHRVG